jgi:hypothetical protein
MTVAVLVFGLWPEEVARESLRKPYVAGPVRLLQPGHRARRAGHGHQVEMPLLEAHGFLKSQVFVPPDLRRCGRTTRWKPAAALALSTCSNCHSLSPPACGRWPTTSAATPTWR